MNRLRKNLHHFFLLLLLVYVTGCSGGGETARNLKGRHFLWEIGKNGSRAYLAGSIHMLKENAYPLPNVFDSTFALSDKLALEMNLDSIDMASVTKLLLSKGMFTDERTLQAVLPDSVYNMAEMKLSEYGFDISAMKKFRPWFVMFTISALELQQSGFEAQHGLDMYFMNKARETEKPVEGLESLKEQVGIFEDISDTAQVDVLYSALVDTQPIGEEMDKLVRAWQRGDTARVQNFMMRELSYSTEARGALLDRRNQNWLPDIEEYVRSGVTVFVVVGAAHLLGKDGLLEMLRNRGYAVRQL